ncbi:MAG: four helix bundle protein [candidate division Zixibacteria bacterium]|nr:four helix bundle protein [candidate division Zixibacteria bacterium]MCK4421187.1 four helix bundle protein [candidate division WOR-3 bacterium]
MDSFKDLKVWGKAHNLVLKIYKITKDFPSDERFRLTDQLCRSASSVPANIAEGQARQTTKEYLQALYIARGSIAETKYHLLLAKDLGYLESSEYNEIEVEYNKVGKMLNSLINSLQRRNPHD